MDLFKAFDTINHELLLVKLHAYGFNKGALKIIHNYLDNRYQRTKINKVFSSWSETQDDLTSLAGKSKIYSFADDMTFHALILT